MGDSVFTKIIRGEVPAYKVYEDDKTIAIIPLRPIAKGHVLVIPKVEVDDFVDLEDVDYQALWSAVKKVARHMREVLKTLRVGVQVVGIEVPHAHVHVIAFDSLDQFHERPDESQPPDTAKMKILADKLRMD